MAAQKMKNAMLIAQEYLNQLPQTETPAQTQQYEGFYHLIAANGTVEKATLSFIIRDHDAGKFQERKDLALTIANALNKRYGVGTVEAVVTDQYRNMVEIMQQNMGVIDLAKQAMKAAGVTIKVQPIRGGTDGARLSFMGLPCPNIFAGGENFHSRFEYVPIPSMEKAKNVILQIVALA